MTCARGGPVRLLVLLWLAAVSCRTTIIGVAPILPNVIEDLGLSHTAGGFLFSLPLLMMGLMAIPGGLLADRVGPGRVIALGLLVLAAGSALRAGGGSAGLFAATALLGGAIGIIQPALPRVVRERFPERIGLATAVYSSGYTVGTLVAVLGTSAWLLPALGDLGWQGTFVFWGLIAGATAVGWRGLLGPGGGAGRSAVDLGAFGPVLRDALLWRVAVVQMTNSAAFFAANAWLTAYYESLAWPPARAAIPLGVLTGVGAVAGFLAPALTDRLRARRPLLLIACAVAVVGMTGIALAPASFAWVWSGLFGFGIFGSFTISLALPVDISPPARVGTSTGVALTVGYVGALIGPLLVGYLHDVTESFSGGIAAMFALTAVMTAVALTVPETYGRATAGRPGAGVPAGRGRAAG